MIASLLMLIATFGRTYKEAQTYASYVVLVVNLLPMTTVFMTHHRGALATVRARPRRSSS